VRSNDELIRMDERNNNAAAEMQDVFGSKAQVTM
jgi:hypothetical protein